MKTVIVASTSKSAGKTSMIVALAASLGGRCGYVKPVGDRLLYKKKRLWDFDAMAMADLWALETNPEDITIGFEHAKLRFMYDETTVGARLAEMIERGGAGRDAVFVEAGPVFSFATSLFLDPISMQRATGGELVLVLTGQESTILDEAHFIRRYLADNGARVAGVIVNKVADAAEFESLHRDELAKLDMPLWGVVPFVPQLASRSVRFLVERLLARVVAGEPGLERAVENVFIGAMSVSAAMGDPLFERPGKLFITSGDRSDMILLAIESGASAVLLTNNQVPPSNILSRASQEQIPLLLVPWDTYTTVQKVEQVEALLAPGDQARAGALAALAALHIKPGW